MAVVFSGIQPTGDIHLGNYIGAVSGWVDLQNKPDTTNIYCIVDLHAITVYQDPKILNQNIIKLAAFLIACGIDTDKSVLFVQSTNNYHSELAWILNCIARIGWLNRMTQFKEKAGNNKEKSSVGLYAYPVLQAADILLYGTNIVPVGEDQKQHIELARDIAMKFNHDFGCSVFTIPDSLIVKETARIMSLRDETKKMSKSDPAENSKILFSDSNDMIVQKIMKSKTDSLPMPSTIEELEDRRGVSNLFNIYSFFSKKSKHDILLNYQGGGFARFKQDLANLVVEIVAPIREKQVVLLNNQDYIQSMLKHGAEKAREMSSLTIQEVKKTVGCLLV